MKTIPPIQNNSKNMERRRNRIKIRSGSMIVILQGQVKLPFPRERPPSQARETYRFVLDMILHVEMKLNKLRGADISPMRRERDYR